MRHCGADLTTEMVGCDGVDVLYSVQGAIALVNFDR